MQYTGACILVHLTTWTNPVCPPSVKNWQGQFNFWRMREIFTQQETFSTLLSHKLLQLGRERVYSVFFLCFVMLLFSRFLCRHSQSLHLICIWGLEGNCRWDQIEREKGKKNCTKKNCSVGAKRGDFLSSYPRGNYGHPHFFCPWITV